MKNNKIYLKQIETGMMQNFNYLVGCLDTNECTLVDPAFEIDRIIKIANTDGYNITSALLTHTHYDHMDGLDKLSRDVDLKKIFVHKNEAKSVNIKFKEKILEVEDGDFIYIGKTTLKVIHTPGHLPGCVCYLGPDFVITGDTLFINAIGRCDFPESNKNEMYKSLQKLKSLPDETVVYPGHNYGITVSSTIGHEKVNNLYMMVQSEESFLKI